MIHRKLDSGN